MSGWDTYPRKWNEDIALSKHDRVFRLLFDRLIPPWIRPNHITLSRFFLIPFVLYFLSKGNYAVGVPFFLFTALTDALDGSLARVRRQITEWGILYDPLADKLLIGSVLFLIVLKHINFAIGMTLLVVEAGIIIGAWIRVKIGKREVRPANIWGKIKMASEVVGISLLLFALWFDVSLLVEASTGTLALALTVAIVSILSRLH